MSFGIPVRNGLGVGLLASTSLSTRNRAGFSPASLFALSEPGAWYDPSDLATLFQDSAGTTPVTTPGQSVGLMLDKSGRGNHATQSNAAQRPTYGIVPAGGRRNLLTFTEQFDNGGWTKSGTTISADAATAPDGTLTADKLVETAATSAHSVRQTASAGTYVVTVFAKAAERSFLQIAGTTTDQDFANFDLSTGVLGTKGTSVTLHTITPAGNGWYRCCAVMPVNSQGPYFLLQQSASAGWLTSYAGNGTSGILIWGAQLEVGSTATAYQRVGTAFDVTEAGVASMSYVSFDGTDDGMLTGNIVPGTDKAQVFAGVRKLSDAARGTVVELSASAAANNGTLQMTAPNAASSTFAFESKGTVLTDAVATGLAAPTTRVVTGLADIAGDSAIIRQNGTVADTDTSDQGTGNFLTYPLYIGRRSGTTLPFNGQIFGLIVRFGTNLPAATITQTETWLGARVAPTVVIP